jgi:hypothetical protein
MTVVWMFDNQYAVGAGVPTGGVLINSDTLTPAEFAWDIMHHGYAWRGFQLPHAPSLAPDIIVTVLLQCLTGDWRWAYIIYAALYLCSMTLLTALIARSVVGINLVTGSSYFLMLIIPILVIETATPTLVHLHIQSFSHVAHGGPFLLSIAGVYLLWLACRAPSTMHLLSVFGIGVLAVLSDRLCFATFVAPALAGLMNRWWWRAISWRWAALMLVTVVSSACIAWKLFDWLLTEGTPEIQWFALPTHATALVNGIGHLAKEAPRALAVVCGVPLLAMALLRMSIIRRAVGLRLDLDRQEAFSFWWHVAATAVAADFALDALIHTDAFRYLGAVIWWPVIVVVWALAGALGRLGAPVSAVTVGGLILSLGSANASNGLHQPVILTGQQPLATCVLQAGAAAGLRAGLANYWLARVAVAASGWRLQIDPITSSGSAHYWANDRYAYINDSHHSGEPPPYNFIVVNGLETPAIRVRYGDPDRTLECGAFSIWIYDDLDRLRRTLALLSAQVFASFLADGRPLCVPGLNFFGRDAAVDGMWLRVALKGSYEGFTTAGPYITIPAGDWRVRLSYELSSPQSEDGRWEVADLPQGRLSTGRHVAETTISLKRRKDNVEVRTTLPAGAVFELYSVEVIPEPAIKRFDDEPCMPPASATAAR